MTNGKAYHREDLRAELLAAGRLFVTANGHGSLSMRDIAQQVGVSPGAPYRHFPDRRSFLLALALQGFSDLLGRTQVFLAHEHTPLAKLEGIAHLFLDFSNEQPAMLALMYESELTRPILDPAVHAAQLEGYRTLRNGVVSLCPDLSESDVDVRVIGLWSTLYGFASLRNSKMVQPYTPAEVSIDIISVAIVHQAVRASIS